MPLFDYQCPNCARVFEMLAASASEQPNCPHCLAALKRLPSAPAVHFKGSGFYETDYKKKQ